MNMESENDQSQNSQQSSHRSRRTRSSRHSGLKIWGLSFALIVTLVVLFISFVYSGSRIEALSTRSDLVQQELIQKTKEVNELKADLGQTKKDMEELIKGRLPSVMQLVPDKVLAVK